MEIQNLDESLQKARERLKDIPQPSSLVPSNPGARQYSNQLAAAKGAFQTTVPQSPLPIKSKEGSKSINDYNALISSSNYQQTIAVAGQILNADQALFSHQSSVMAALANLLEYNPVSDLSSNNSTILNQNLESAKGGLQKTIERLNSISKYQNDTNFSQLIIIVNQVQLSREALQNNLDTPLYIQFKTDYVSTVKTAQTKIVDNRQEFWADQSEKLFNLTDQSERTIVFYFKILRSL